MSSAAGRLWSAASARRRAIWRSVRGRHRSMKTSMMPPQVPICCWSKSPVRSTSANRASPPSSSNTRALRKTSASPQPPPIVPNWPSSRTIILAPTSRGVEPRTLTTVANANGLSRSRVRTASAQISSGPIMLNSRSCSTLLRCRRRADAPCDGTLSVFLLWIESHRRFHRGKRPGWGTPIDCGPWRTRGALENGYAVDTGGTAGGIARSMRGLRDFAASRPT